MPRAELLRPGQTPGGLDGIASMSADEMAAMLSGAADASAALAGHSNVRQPTAPASGAAASTEGAAAGAKGAAAAAPPAADEVAIDTRRKPEEIAAFVPKKDGRQKTSRDAAEFKAMPAGPFPEREKAVAAFERFQVANGYKKPFIASSRPAGPLRGAQISLACPYSKRLRESTGTGKRKSAPAIVLDPDNPCHWCVTLEESTAGWVILHAVCDHTEHERDAPRAMGEAEATMTFTEHRSKVPDQLINCVTADMKLLRPTIPAS